MSQAEQEKKIVIRLTPKLTQDFKARGSSSRMVSQEKSERFSEIEDGKIISVERESLAMSRDSLLGEYYDNLEKLVLEMSKAK
jgi:hypothetical protein